MAPNNNPHVSVSNGGKKFVVIKIDSVAVDNSRFWSAAS